MGIYNVRLYDYAGGKKQVRVYSRPIITDSALQKRTRKRLETMERNKKKFVRPNGKTDRKKFRTEHEPYKE